MAVEPPSDDEKRKMVEEATRAMQRQRKGDRAVRDAQRRRQADLGRVPNVPTARDVDFDPFDPELP